MSSFLKFIFYISVLFIIVLSLFPGSLLGLFFYGDLNKQPSLVNNPFGTAINHFICYIFIATLGLFTHLRNEYFQRLVFALFTLAIILEIFQFIVPNRTFQLLDLAGNFLGVLFAYFLVKIYLFLSKS